MEVYSNYKNNRTILFIGNISLDIIKNRQGISRTIIGGGAYISAYCAKMVSNNLKIKILSILGNDFPLDIINFLRDKKIDVSEIQIVSKNSNSFIIEEGNNKSKIKIKNLLELGNFPIREKIDHLHVSCRKGVKSPYFYLTTSKYEKSSMDVIFSSLKEKCKEIKKCLELIDMVFLNSLEYKMLNKYIKPKIESFFPEVIFVITQGEKGVSIKKGKKVFYFPGIKIDKKKNVSNTGAGDAFLGSFLGSYYSSNSPIEALMTAVSAATLSLQDFGITHLGNKLSILKNYQNKLLSKYKKMEDELSEIFFTQK